MKCSHYTRLDYFRSSNMLAGDSRYPFHMLENLAMVAPSIHLWSADQDTFITCLGKICPLGEYLGTV